MSRAGVVLREVQRLEVVEVALNLWAQGGGVAEMVEDFDDAIHRGDKRVRDAGLAGDAGERNVDVRQHRPSRGGWSFENRFDLLLQLIKLDTERLARFSGRALQPCFGDQLESPPCLRPSQCRRNASWSSVEDVDSTSSVRPPKSRARLASS